MTVTLPQITSLARSGALDRAWDLFVGAGYDAAAGDPAALAVKGRLHKDLALRAAGAERARQLGASEAAYTAADALSPQPYLLINVATLAFLAGDRARAEAAAHEVLVRLGGGAPIAETPYWLAATRAEALLLLGDIAGADAALAEARAANPDGWSDHASTLRQFRLIAEAAGGDPGWLDKHRPPRSLHFAGHLGIAPAGAAPLRARIEAVLDEEGIGFGYGALAAGADIMIAEALLARGAELHIVLPVGRAEFVAQSIAPYGADWNARFEACIARAATVREATRVTGAYEPAATSLAAEMAMGAAMLNARLFESGAAQLLIVDEGEGPFGAGAGTARDGTIWRDSPHRQQILRWPRTAPVAPSSSKQEGRRDRRLMAMLLVRFDGIDALGEGDFAAILDERIAPFWDAAARLPGQPVVSQPGGNGRLLGFGHAAAAAAFARRLQDIAPPGTHALMLSGHYGLVHDAVEGVVGPAVATLAAIGAATQPGTITVSEAFATAMAVRAADPPCATPVGDHDGLELFALQ